VAVDNETMLEKTLLAALPSDRRPTEDEVLETATRLRAAFPMRDEAFDELIKRVHSKLAITMDLGTALVDAGYVPWLAGRKAQIDPYYSDRFRVWLGRVGWAPLVINALDRVSDEILDQTGDPSRTGAWSRRGLVVGDVQSGKTATYTALACKAADSGYRLIILLTGTLESLRRQTQERLDEGFVGLDSSEMLQQAQIRTNRAVGVGIIDQRRAAGVFTSRSRDFSRQLMTQLGFRLDAFQEPVLVVLKKNKRILENLHSWLSGYNAGPDGRIAAPLLLIDDEADSASINTNVLTSDPTAINEKLRSILALFHRSTYVGFTATPFANVFIEPETDDEMLGDDLFPRDFIYTLEAPTNYVGPRAMFVESPEMVRRNDDAEAYVPARHKNHHPVDSLPPSLLEALRCFLIANAIRDLRGEGQSHRSMLVNVSRFTAVQDRVAQLLDSELREVQRDVRNFSNLASEEALTNPSLAALRRTYDREYAGAGYDWPELQSALHEAIQPIAVRSINQRTGAASLDYKANREQGLRVIAVGGNSLSRGLTLEGLSQSYFYRNSQMYDTLLQMGRWFGYRDGYADLCRVWLSDEAFHWYSHITMASDELREEFKRMRRLDLTPRDFGLKVRAHPDSLIVTARNKMRSAQTIVRQISLDAEGIETARLRSNPAVIQFNANHGAAFLERLEKAGHHHQLSEWGNPIWRDVPKALIADFLRDFQSHPLNYDFQGEQLAKFLSETREKRLQRWDVVVPGGSVEERVVIGPIAVKPSLRRVVVRADNNSLLISGARARVGSRGIEREGLTTDQYQAVLREHDGRNVSDRAYRLVRAKPLLLIHVVKGYLVKSEESTEPDYFEPNGPPVIAIGLSFPAFDDREIAGKVEYKVNAVEWRNLVGSEEDDDLVDEADDLD
jgi:hypothetical protein